MRIERFEADAVLILATGKVAPAGASVEASRPRVLRRAYRNEQPWHETLMALRKFQSDHGLRVTGCPDSDTMTLLRESYCF